MGVQKHALLYCLAAAAVVVAATVIACAQQAVAAAVAQQQNDDDNPANVTTTETIVVTHIQIPPKFCCGVFTAHSKIFRVSKKVQNFLISIVRRDICPDGSSPAVPPPPQAYRPHR